MTDKSFEAITGTSKINEIRVITYAKLRQNNLHSEG